MADIVDPLSLLAGADSSSSDSETEENGTEKSLIDKSYYTPSSTDSSDKLPSPSTLFATVLQPKFLTNHIDPHHVNWDKLVKTAELTTPLTDHTSDGKFSAIPPPQELDDTKTSNYSKRGEISAAPVRYDQSGDSLEVNSKVGDKRLGTREEDDVDEDLSGSVKKQKVETFREKEKRKRDLGMTSRGKNFVEEEKRVLREQFSSH